MSDIQLNEKSNYVATWYLLPSRIRRLPGMTLAYLDVYETIFQFLNKDRDCFICNKSIAERLNISVRCVQKSLRFFEKHGELKRVLVGTRHYFVVPEKRIQIEDEPLTNNQTIANESARGGERPFMGGVNARSPINKEHKKRKINNHNHKSDESYEVLKDIPTEGAPKPPKQPPMALRLKILTPDEQYMLDKLKALPGMYPAAALAIVEQHMMATINYWLEEAYRPGINCPGSFMVSRLHNKCVQQVM